MTAGYQHLHGRRVRAVRWAPSELIDDNKTVPPGTEGTITGSSPAPGNTQLWVDWDNGARLSLLVGHDQYLLLQGGGE